MLVRCTSDSAPEDPFSDYAPDPEVYFKPVRADRIVTVDNQLAAADQVLLLLKEDATASDLQAAVDSVDGSLVGQIPAEGIYQIEIPTASASDIEAMLTVLDAQPGVQGSAFNVVPTPMGAPPSYCTAQDDLHAVATGNDRCALDDVQYFLMVPLLEKIKEIVSLTTPVWVAVIDSGIDTASPQFGDVPVLNLDDPDATQPIQPIAAHASQVAGIIAADNHDGGPNGIASRVIGGQLRLLSASAGGHYDDPLDWLQCVMGVAVGMSRAAHRDLANVVNMSFGLNFSAAQSARGRITNLLFSRIMAHSPHTLFVMAAGNEDMKITIHNYAPVSTDPVTGTPLDNAITVGGTAHCNPSGRFTWGNGTGSNFGPLVEIAAPGERVPVMDYRLGNPGHPESGACVFESGTSFATAQVTSLAAILWFVDPTLTPSDVKHYIVDYSDTTDASLSGHRMVLTKPVEQLVLDRLDPSDELRRIIEDAGRPNHYQEPAFAVNAICGNSTFGANTPSDPEEGTMFEPGKVTGALNDLITTIQMVQDDNPARQVTVSLSVNASFRLEAFSIDDPANVTWTVLKEDGTATAVGSGTAGHVAFLHCAILERDEWSHAPSSVLLTGSAGGVLDANFPPSMEVVPVTFNASFHTTAAAMISDPALARYLEENCEGGRP